MMKIILYFFLTISIVFILGMIYFFMTSFNAGVFPPRKHYQQRAIVFGGGGVIFLLLTFIMYMVK